MPDTDLRLVAHDFTAHAPRLAPAFHTANAALTPYPAPQHTTIKDSPTAPVKTIPRIYLGPNLMDGIL